MSNTDRSTNGSGSAEHAAVAHPVPESRFSRDLLTESRPESEITRQALDYWSGLWDGGRMPARRNITPEGMMPFLPNVILFDVLDRPTDFRYRLIGTKVVAYFARDYTGRCMREIPHQTPPSTVWTCCSKVVETGRPYSFAVPYEGPKKQFIESEDLILPLSEDGETVNMLLVVVNFGPRRTPFSPLQPHG